MQNKNPLISIIVPTFNRREKLENALNSITSQTIGDHEIIVIDDASTDSTSIWIAENHPNIKLITLTQNRGAAGARNEGIRIASGKFIAFLDSDDQWLPNYLEEQIKVFEKRPNVVLSASDFIGENNTICKCRTWSIYPSPTHHMLMNAMIYTMSVVIIRREILEKSGLLHESLKICHDRELYLRLLKFGDFFNLSSPLAIRVQNDDSVSARIHLYKKEVFEVLDIFFGDPYNQSYKYLEPAARSKWALNIARSLAVSKRNKFFLIWMIIVGFYHSPNLVLESIFKRAQ